MSFVIKCFTTINRMLDGVSGNVAPLGELSNHARTFSTVKTTIADEVSDLVSIEVFSCREDGIRKDMPSGSSAFLLGTMNTIVKDVVNSIPFPDQFVTLFTDITLEYVGPTIQHDGRLLPGFIRFSKTIEGEPCQFQVWLSDATFRQMYDEYEIRVIPPVPNPQDLDNDAATLLQIITDYSYTERLTAVETIRGNDPITRLVTVMLKWTEPNGTAQHDLVWTLIVFGERGLVYDNQLQAIRDYLQDNTTKLPEEWSDWIPDLVTEATITIIPLWDKIAIQSSGSLHAMYSPAVTVEDFTTTLRRRYNRDPSAEELNKTAHLLCPYKSIGFLAFPEPNSGEHTLFLELYPKYTFIPINDLNMGQLGAKAGNALRAIEKGMRIAEQDEAVVNLPPNHTVLHYEGRNYISYSVDGINHRIMTKKSYLTQL